jgi:hypothetical protein
MYSKSKRILLRYYEIKLQSPHTHIIENLLTLKEIINDFLLFNQTLLC